MIGIKDGYSLSNILVDATISAGFGAMGGPIDVGILDAGAWYGMELTQVTNYAFYCCLNGE